MQYFINAVCTFCSTVLPSLNKDIILSYLILQLCSVFTSLYITWRMKRHAVILTEQNRTEHTFIYRH